MYANEGDTTTTFGRNARQYRPPVDLAGLAAGAQASGRLSLTAVWLSRFLGVVAACDPAALRLPYYKALLATLAAVYRGAAAGGRSAGAAQLLRWSLGGLFARAPKPSPPATPAPAAAAAPAAGGLDALALCDAAALAELCPQLRELQAALAAAMSRARAAPPPRHVTPLRVAPLPADRAASRDRELQVRSNPLPRTTFPLNACIKANTFHSNLVCRTLNI